MIVKCAKCGRRFDDEFRTTICEHETFAANDGHNNFRHYHESYIQSTKEFLVEALREHAAPSQIVDRALRGQYDDYESDSATPMLNLVSDLSTAGLHDLAKRAIKGEFDGTKQESQMWFNKEGKDLLGL